MPTAEPSSDAQPSATETSTASTGSVPAAPETPPPSLAIPDKPEFGDVVIKKATAPAPVPSAETAKAIVEPPPAPTPAELLGLTGKERARAERCLANAIYFEARGEPPRGQVAVAQVVMNRVFSPYYPKDVCGVVYQNAERHLACQFTFACDGLKKTYSERGAWWRAQRIAKQTLDGKVWIASVAKSTHYHAYWVNPSWVAEMKKMWRYGVHTFYRPHRWGDGAQEAGWVRAPLPVLAPKAQATGVPTTVTTAAPASTTATAAPATTANVTAPAAAAPAKSVAAPAVAKADVKPLPKIDPKAKEAKAAASKADTKAVPLKVDNKKSDTKVSPIYTDGKRSDAKSPAKASNKVSAKVDTKTPGKTVQAKTKPAPKSAATPGTAKPSSKTSAKPKPSPKTADQTNSTRKL